MRIAVVGAGVSGLIAARVLARAGMKVVVYEQEDYVGGHARTIQIDGIPIDVGFMVFNQVTYPNMVSFFEEIGVDMESSDMSFSVSLNEGKGCEWGSDSLAGLFSQKRNLFNPYFIQMIREIFRFQHDVLCYLEQLERQDDSIDWNETLGQFLTTHGYSQKFRNCYLVPVCGSIWSCSTEQVLNFSARTILTFFRNHHLLQVLGRPQWMVVKGRSETYVNKVVEELESNGCKIRTSCKVHQISTSDKGVLVTDSHGGDALYDKCIIGAHAPDALAMLGDASYEERAILGAVQYSYSDIYVHRDKSFMPKNVSAWSSWNFLGDTGGRVSLTYWINKLQNLGDTGLPILVTLNPLKLPNGKITKWCTSHPVPSPSAVSAMSKIGTIQGKRGVWFCGAYRGYGFHEDGLKAGLTVAKGILGEQFSMLENVRPFVLTWSEIAGRLAAVTFLRSFIRRGQLKIIEDGGTVLDFVGKDAGLRMRCTLKIHRASFYWKVATRADLGLADAYVDGDFSCADATNGLLMLFMILIVNRDFKDTSSKSSFRGWWTPALPTAIVSSSVSYLTHILQNNSLTNARRNISRHYDLSNDLFSLFLDETMTYSCAIFEGPKEDLKDAQLRKLHRLIDKARVQSYHEVLEIGCGWGSLAIELVQRTGCKYTGITLSEEQLKWSERRVKEAGLQERITLKLCDYRKVHGCHQYDRIISCEMIEAVGHEYYMEFFRTCDKLLAKDGLLVVQVITIPEARYDEYRRSSDFIKEYIFPGGCTPSLSTLTAAMSRASSLCVEHLENIGIHYYQTLIHWQNNFRAKHSELYRLGFDTKFLRTWDYYFAYCAAGFKTCTLSNLQIVFSRPGNITNFGN
ncbi:hypothetical protein O6H91_21G068400 [Diphasiastrum complanatum]|uniref:Uncharacterized protein n=14 Tax=Diphasiastrum complanatum TaxID=34168 RepID=A0ACC2ALR4_DIPCM|nr:hypothetical protein O6H91_21G068400 [Diphasiastrum complanatum]KAJ7518419.1 hypothetical protein O6H91_21G068400 [Diphasiastrum complanatum]KAJ7518420.1 hypothetical protein O6H91_21G068400 [Diphasiastrum complanatum]KAJ7518421.1 hypothetical protein O6H91_21G068400 [Diphasiastrum complanatum]KAJ7518422.1 hypothetical protein O6H91_21G068400 [Diphasiastrum complanatum]